MGYSIPGRGPLSSFPSSKVCLFKYFVPVLNLGCLGGSNVSTLEVNAGPGLEARPKVSASRWTEMMPSHFPMPFPRWTAGNQPKSLAQVLNTSPIWTLKTPFRLFDRVPQAWSISHRLLSSSWHRRSPKFYHRRKPQRRRAPLSLSWRRR